MERGLQNPLTIIDPTNGLIPFILQSLPRRRPIGANLSMLLLFVNGVVRTIVV